MQEYWWCLLLQFIYMVLVLSLDDTMRVKKEFLVEDTGIQNMALVVFVVMGVYRKWQLSSSCVWFLECRCFKRSRNHAES